MAAESASLSQAIDRPLYPRQLTKSILHGEPNLSRGWRMSLKIPGYIVTGAKGMYDHSSKSRSVPCERQTLIDLVVAQDLHEHGACRLHGLPNKHMLADVLTKAINPKEVYQKLCDEGLFNLVPTGSQVSGEGHRLALRQSQRLRARELKNAKKNCKP